MNNKILLGSIIAVIILVLVSFTGVVGYQTTKSSTIARASPLFKVRTNRAIDKESKDLTCDYVGKGRQTLINFPKQDDRIALIQKFIERISKMDEKEANRVLNLIVRKIYEKKMITDKNIHEVKKLLLNSKSNLSAFNNGLIIEKKDALFTKFDCPTQDCTGIPGWLPGCIILQILLILFSPIILLIEILKDIKLTFSGECITYEWQCFPGLRIFLTILFACAEE